LLIHVEHASCKKDCGDEQLCDEGMTGTYNSYEEAQKIPMVAIQQV
jgi:hypothetical protein